MKNIDIRVAKSKIDFEIAKSLIIEYVKWLNIDLTFQYYDNEINNLQDMYIEPKGGLIIASENNIDVGVVGIREFEGKICELKRMYVKEHYRKSGIGREMLEMAVDYAKSLGYCKIKLDTLSSLQAAIKLYLDYGFIETSAYRYNPSDLSVRYFELELISDELVG